MLVSSDVRWFYILCYSYHCSLFVIFIVINDDLTVQNSEIPTEQFLSETSFEPNLYSKGEVGPPEKPTLDNPKMNRAVLPFIENTGQIDPRVKLYANTFAGTVFVTEQNITYSLKNGDRSSFVLREKFVETNNLNPKGLEKVLLR